MTPSPTSALVASSLDDGTQVIELHGEADASTAARFNERCARLTTASGAGVVADLCDVSFIDSVMLNALVVGQRRITRRKGRFAIVCGEGVRRVLELTGLLRFLDVFTTRDEALAFVRQR